MYPDVEVLVVARFGAQADMARKLGATVISHEPALAVIEQGAEWSGGVLQPSDGLPMAYPGCHRRGVRHCRQARDLRSWCAAIESAGTLVKAGVHGPTFWEDTPLYFKEICFVGSNAFGFEEIDGVRQHGIAHYLDLARDGRVDLDGMLTHTFDLDDWRGAFEAIACQGDTGAIKVAFDYRDRAN